MRDRIEVMERKILKNIIVFIRRCLDVIEFLKIISFEGNSELTKRLLGQVEQNEGGKDLLAEVSKTTFKDFITKGGYNEKNNMMSNSAGVSNVTQINYSAGQDKNPIIQRLF